MGCWSSTWSRVVSWSNWYRPRPTSAATGRRCKPTATGAVPLSLSVEHRQALRVYTKDQLTQRVDEQEPLAAAEEQASEQYEAAIEAWDEVQSQRAEVRAELDPAEAALVAEQKKSSDAEAVLATAQQKQRDTQSRITLLDEAADKLQQAIALVTSAGSRGVPTPNWRKRSSWPSNAPLRHATAKSTIDQELVARADSLRCNPSRHRPCHRHGARDRRPTTADRV